MASWFTLQQLLDFHSIDRQVYARLVIELGLDCKQAKKIVAFWYWLEREGYKNFIKNMVQLPNHLLIAFAMEAITCLNCLNKKGFLTGSFDICESTPLMSYLVSQDFSLGEVYAKRERAMPSIERFVKDVCERVFSDIVPRNLTNGFHIQNQPIVRVAAQENNVNVPQDLPIDSHSDRTLFITFSKGHPISKTELRDLITRKFGNCLEAIHMRIEPQPLFARVVVKSVSAMEKILRQKDLVKFSINGKDVWARRFVPKQDELLPLAVAPTAAGQ